MDDILEYQAGTGNVEIIIKYNGDIQAAVEGIGGSVEILSEDYAIVTISSKSINALYDLKETEYLEIPKRMYFMRFSSQQSACIYEDTTFDGMVADGGGTLIGIIDSGIDVYNKDFTNEDGTTRIVGILDLSKGISYTRDDINQALNGGLFTFSDTLGHGTAIAGIAAGNGRASRYKGIAPGCELIVVKLGQSDGYARSTDIMRGLKYIKDMAELLHKPVAINISYGTNDGSHDGNSLLEGFVNEVVDSTVCVICIAMGNEGASGHHYSGNFNNGDSVRFNIAGDVTQMYMSIWKNFTDTVGVIVTAPSGTKSKVFTDSGKVSFDGTTVNLLFSSPTPYNIDTEIYLNFFNDTGVQRGIWTLDFKVISVIDGRFDIWLPVTEAVGKETMFLTPDTDTTLTLPSGAYKAISVGGYNQQTETVLDFSGRGYTRSTNYVKPDIVAPAYNIPAPSVNGGINLFTGTSFATPHVTGVAALIMQWGVVMGNDLFMYGERLKAFLRKGAVRYKIPDYPNQALGYGKLCFENTIQYILKQRNVSDNQQLYIQQVNSVPVSEAALSDEYLDFVGRKSGFMFDMEDNENITVCPIDDSYYVLYIKRDYYNLNKTRLTNTYGIRSPFVMGTMQYESILEKSGILTVQTQPYLNLRGNGILVAVIDTGIDYKNKDFIYEDGTTKIKFIWDQSKQGTGGLCFGTEYTEDDINRALAGEMDLETGDDTGHGTTLASLAAGKNGAAPDADLIVVKVKGAKKYLRETLFLSDDIPAFEASDLMLGVSYAYKKADELDRPLVICIGMGTNEGGHSGQSVLEEYFEAVAKRYGVCLCVPTGNEGIAKHHTSFDFTVNTERKDVELNVAENEAGVNIWIWNFIVNSVAVELISPLGETVTRLKPITNYEGSFTLPRGGGVVEVKYFVPEDIANDQFTHIRIIRPATGIWTIRLYNNNATAGIVHLWLPISTFVKEDTFFLNPDPMVTLTTPSTAASIMVTGGYNTADNSIYPPTGRGPTRYFYPRPHFCAPAVNIDGKSGTSLACAITAGAAALMMEWLILRNGIYTTNTITVSAYFMKGAERTTGDTYPNNVWGYGRLNLYASFESL
jgi:subtilisin family serine protease